MFYIRDGSSYKEATDDHVLQVATEVSKKQFNTLLDLSTAEKAEPILVPLMRPKRVEVLCGVFLNAEGNMLAFEELAHGSLLSTSCYPRKIVERMLHHNATQLILIHNHPAGNCIPSDDDINTTVKLKFLFEFIEMTLLDHYVVASNGLVSIRRRYEERMKEESENVRSLLKQHLIGEDRGNILNVLLQGLKNRAG